MIKTKSCPRCEGDLFLDADLEGWYEECLQCGYIHDLEGTAEFFEGQPREREEEPRLATVKRA